MVPGRTWMRTKALPPTISARTDGVGGVMAVTPEDTFVGRAGSAAAGAAVSTTAPTPRAIVSRSRTAPGSSPPTADASHGVSPPSDHCHDEPVAAHYKQPGWFTKNVFNRAIQGLTKLGVSVWGSRILAV